MLTETTVTKLREMHLSVMANALKDQTSDSQYVNMAFEDRLGLLVDAEWTARKNKADSLGNVLRPRCVHGKRGISAGPESET